MTQDKSTARDGAIILGWLAFVVGSLLALGWGYGLMAAGVSLILLGLFAVKA